MTEANALNAATAGIVGNTGTSFTGTAVTAHNIIVGGSTSSTLVNVAPSSTSGVPVISQGSSADPAFGTVVVAGGGTGLTTLTAHDVLVGNGTSNVTLVAPSATSGVPLISQGSSADPTYGTAVVAGGGTGDTSFTAYAPVCGGTTTTGALQSASTGQGTSGFVLTSNGSSSLPSFKIVGTTENSWTPVLNFGAATTGITYDVQQGVYVQIGNVVTLQLEIELTSKGSASGNATITGIPVGTFNNDTYECTYRLQNLTFVGVPMFRLTGGTIYCENVASGLGLAALTDTQFANTTLLELTCTYIA